MLRGLFVMLWALLLPLAAAGTATAEPTPAPPVADAQTASVDPGNVQAGDEVKVTGGGWTPGSLVQIALCGENALGGSASCAQQTSMSVTVGNQGTISATLPVVLPPKPCPCVVRIVTVTGGRPMDSNVPLAIDGAPFAPLPEKALTPGRLVFINSRLVGEDSVFTWFGSPVQRRFEIEVGNMGQSSIVNPTFRIGTYEGVYAPTWEDVRWQGTIQPGQRATIRLPIELAPRQHGDFSFRVTYGDQIVDEQALRVGRPWGVYVFGALLIVVVPLTVWRLGARLVEAIGDVRRAKAAERAREVGLPDTPGSAASSGDMDSATAGALVRSRPLRLAPATPAPEPVAVGGGTPKRGVAETLVVSGPLFSGSADTAATVPSDRPRPAAPAVPPAATSAGSSAVSGAGETASKGTGGTGERAADRPADKPIGASVAKPVEKPIKKAAENSGGVSAGNGTVESPEPTTNSATAPAGADAEDATRVLPPAVPVALVRPEDVARGLAWGTARRDADGEGA